MHPKFSQFFTALLITLFLTIPAMAVSYTDEVLTSFSSNPFPDTHITELSGIAAAELKRRDVIGGYPDGEFKGDYPVNRAEAAKFLIKAADISTSSSFSNTSFPDTPQSSWYFPYVLKAWEFQIIGGYPDGTFKPDNTVNTAEFLKMISRTFGITEDLSHSYPDVTFDDWYNRYAGSAKKYNFFPERETNLQPGKLMTRNEVAVAIYQYLKCANNPSLCTESPIGSPTGSPIGSPTGSPTCTYNSKTYSDNDTFKSKDNCSNCFCDDGHVLCESKTCDWAFESEVITLKKGESITNDRGNAKVEFERISMFDVMSGAFKLFNKIDLKWVKIGNFIINNNLNSIYTSSGFDLEYININESSETITIKKHNSCINFYNQCIQGKLNYEFGPNTSDKEFQCAKICKEEPSPIEYLYEPGGKIKGIFAKEFKEYGLYLTNNYNICYEKLKDYFEFDITNNELFAKLMIVDSNGGGALAGANTEYIYQEKSDIEISLNEVNINNLQKIIDSGFCSGMGAAPHELTHTFVTKSIISPDSYYDDISLGVQWLNEGLANYMQNFSEAIRGKDNLSQVTCHNDGYKYPRQDKKPFVTLSSKDGSFSDGYYTTGACFWDYIYKEFGETKFKKLLKYIGSTRYKSGTYKIFDEFKNILSEDISDIAYSRFGLNKDLTVVIY